MNNNELVPGFDDEKDDSLKIILENIPEVNSCLMVILNGYIDTYNSVFFHTKTPLETAFQGRILLLLCISLFREDYLLLT